MIIRVTPVGEEMQRLRHNVGLDCYHIHVGVVEGLVSNNGKEFKVWMYWWRNIAEAVIREHLLKEEMKRSSLSRSRAIKRLRRVMCAVPQDQVTVEVVASYIDEEE